MYNLIKRLSRYGAVGATALTYYSFGSGWLSKNEAIQFKKDVNTNFDLVNAELTTLVEKLDTVTDANTKTQMAESAADFRKQLLDLKTIHEDYLNKFENGVVSSSPGESLSVYEQHKEKFQEAFSKLDKTAYKIDKYLNETTNKFMDDFNIWNMIDQYMEFLATLSPIEHVLVINLTTSIFIFLCFTSILSAFYGNYFIEKFSLEKKFPKLKKIILLRVKFQHYYIIVNFIYITVALLALIIVNILTLFMSQ